MKRLVSVFSIVALVVSLVLAASSGTPSSAQTGEQSTIEAQETRISELEKTAAARGQRMNAQRTEIAEFEAELAGESAPTEVAAEQVETGSDSPYLGGTGLELLPAGAAGEVEVVLQGVYDGSILPIIVRNNSDEAIGRVAVAAAVRSAAGDLVGAGGDQGFNPSRVEPGSYAIGYLYFDGATLPNDATFDFDVSFEEPDGGSFSSIDMTMVEATFLGDRIVGTLLNEHDEPMSGPINIAVMCLTADCAILDHESGYTDQDNADPGQSIPFQVSFFGGIDCTYFVIAASGYNF